MYATLHTVQRTSGKVYGASIALPSENLTFCQVGTCYFAGIFGDLGKCDPTKGRHSILCKSIEHHQTFGMRLLTMLVIVGLHRFVVEWSMVFLVHQVCETHSVLRRPLSSCDDGLWQSRDESRECQGRFCGHGSTAKIKLMIMTTAFEAFTLTSIIQKYHHGDRSLTNMTRQLLPGCSQNVLNGFVARHVLRVLARGAALHRLPGVKVARCDLQSSCLFDCLKAPARLRFEACRLQMEGLVRHRFPARMLRASIFFGRIWTIPCVGAELRRLACASFRMPDAGCLAPKECKSQAVARPPARSHVRSAATHAAASYLASWVPI